MSADLSERVLALSKHRQLMLLSLLVGSNPADVERELATLLAAVAGGTSPALRDAQGDRQ